MSEPRMTGAERIAAERAAHATTREALESLRSSLDNESIAHDATKNSLRQMDAINERLRGALDRIRDMVPPKEPSAAQWSVIASNMAAIATWPGLAAGAALVAPPAPAPSAVPEMRHIWQDAPTGWLCSRCETHKRVREVAVDLSHPEYRLKNSRVWQDFAPACGTCSATRAAFGHLQTYSYPCPDCGGTGRAPGGGGR